VKTKELVPIELSGGPLCGLRRIMTAPFLRVLQLTKRGELHEYRRSDDMTARGRRVYRHAGKAPSFGMKGGEG
jgi:hypothetical protein